MAGRHMMMIRVILGLRFWAADEKEKDNRKRSSKVLPLHHYKVRRHDGVVDAVLLAALDSNLVVYREVAKHFQCPYGHLPRAHSHVVHWTSLVTHSRLHLCLPKTSLENISTNLKRTELVRPSVLFPVLVLTSFTGACRVPRHQYKSAVLPQLHHFLFTDAYN